MCVWVSDGRVLVSLSPHLLFALNFDNPFLAAVLICIDDVFPYSTCKLNRRWTWHGLPCAQPPQAASTMAVAVRVSLPS